MYRGDSTVQTLLEFLHFLHGSLHRSLEARPLLQAFFRANRRKLYCQCAAAPACYPGRQRHHKNVTGNH